jgi:Fis family transcriptional regulator
MNHSSRKPSGSKSSGAEISPPLGDHVRAAVRQYLERIDGFDAGSLHALVMAEAEKALIGTILEVAGHNQTRAARILGLSRGTLRKKMALYGLE